MLQWAILGRMLCPAILAKGWRCPLRRFPTLDLVSIAAKQGMSEGSDLQNRHKNWYKQLYKMTKNRKSIFLRNQKLTKIIKLATQCEIHTLALFVYISIYLFICYIYLYLLIVEREEGLYKQRASSCLAQKKPFSFSKSKNFCISVYLHPEKERWSMLLDLGNLYSPSGVAPGKFQQGNDASHEGLTILVPESWDQTEANKNHNRTVSTLLALRCNNYLD